MKKRFDLDKMIELSFIEDVKLLQKYGLNEYYDKVNRGLFEFLNPELSYPYSLENMSDGQKMWKVKKQDNDPTFVVTLKKQGLDTKYWVLDFYFPEVEKGFDKNKEGLQGKHYIDTLAKIIKDEVIPYFDISELDILFFRAYTRDGAGNMRKSLFQRLIDKFVDKSKYNTKIEDLTFIINKIKNND
jgi:hypothetical protein